MHQGLSTVPSSQAPFPLPHNSQAQRQEVQKDTVVEGHQNGNCSLSARHTRPLHANMYLAPQPVRQTHGASSCSVTSTSCLGEGRWSHDLDKGLSRVRMFLKSLLSSLKWASKDDCHLTSPQETQRPRAQEPDARAAQQFPSRSPLIN